MTGATYDAGALIALERRDKRMINMHKRVVRSGVRPVVPAGVLAQVWRGGSGRQAPLARVLKQCTIEPLDETLAKQVGEAGKRLISPDVVDISVVVGALGRGDQVFTSDPDDIERISNALGEGPGLLIHTV